MRHLARLFRAAFALAVIGCGAPWGARAETISNVAQISWDQDGRRMSRESNRVDIEVDAKPSFSVQVYDFAHNGSISLPIAAPLCRSNAIGPQSVGGGTATAKLGTPFAGIVRTPALVTRIDKVRAGNPLVFELSYPAGNRNPAQIESVIGVMLTQSGDREVLTIYETGADTGRFSGFIQTALAPQPRIAGDCLLTVAEGDRIFVDSVGSGSETTMAPVAIDVLIDPYGIVFDSEDGEPVSGVGVTIVDDATGQPAEVFGNDGRSRYPSTVTTGATVTDAGGTVYPIPPGDYRFPLLRAGRYRLMLTPPAPYTAWSTVPPDQFAGLRQPNGLPFEIVPGSFGGVIVLDDPAPVRVDIPIDRPKVAITVTKSASQARAVPGEVVLYTVTARNADTLRAKPRTVLIDELPRAMRLRADTVRVDGAPAADAVTITADGRSLNVTLGTLAPGATRTVRYALEVRPDATPGDAINRARVRDARGTESAVADAIVRIERDIIAGRLTIIGQVLDGGCGVDPRAARGIAGVRVMLEDGSYAVSDSDGRYHFEGVLPGIHVVQIDGATLPADRAAVDCAKNTRSGGNPLSRFVEGQGGALLRADFHAAASAPRAITAIKALREAARSDPQAAGAERDWFAGQTPGIAWLFPEAEHNPRARVVRVAIKHLPGQTVALFLDGKPVDKIAFDGTRANADNMISVSLWRGIPLAGHHTRLTAEVRDASGAVVEKLDRNVSFSASPLRAQLLRDRSVLVADGVSRPVIAVRLTDRDGRPVHHGLVGDFTVPAPYYPAVEADAQQARQLSGLERARPVWRVVGDEGIAYVELEPTTASGTVSLTFGFKDGEVARSQRVEAWLDPGDRPWTIVGFAAGTVGFNTLNGRIEDLANQQDDIVADARLALYARGRVQGKWLLTLAYDSDKQADEARFAGTIDPQAYYTIYADRSERRYDAASVRRLYLRLERPQFYALFGDYETGIDEPQLARYARAFNGVKAEYRGPQVAATAFAADTPTRFRREELQGNGLTGPYALASRAVLANSERVTIEVRDRLRSNLVIDSRTLIRHIDYDIDYAAGTLRFREPILSRSSDLDPQFIIAGYEVEGVAERVVNAGGRASWQSGDEKLRIAATVVSDADETRRTNLGGVDVRYQPTPETEVRAEIAASDVRSDGGLRNGTATAWLVEAEHHGPAYDLLAYVREQEGGFGVGQLSASEDGTRKFGFDGRVRLSSELALIASAWRENALLTAAQRQAARAQIEYRTRAMDVRGGLSLVEDRLADGSLLRSSIAQLGATRRFFGNRLELDAQTEFALGGADDSVDFPARHKLGGRFAVTSDVALVAGYEIASGETVDARTARIGFDLKPWAGARLTATANNQDIAEYGPRSFAAYGLAQSLQLGKGWSVDFSLDGNRTLDGLDPATILNPNQPVASGGFLGGDGTLTEDFTALTAGATYRSKGWSWTGRAEYRAGDTVDRYGITSAALRQIGEGSAIGAAFSWLTAEEAGGVATRATSLELSWAHRPQASRWTWLEKLELREDRVTGAVLGEAGPIGGAPLTVSGDVASRRLVNSLSINFSPSAGAGGSFLDRSELALFWGSRYVFDRFDDVEIVGWSNLLGLDARLDLSAFLDVGGAFSVRQSAGNRSRSYALGPSIGIRPFDNGWLSLGYNIVGFSDRDFDAARYTRSGPYVTMRLKFDQGNAADLGLLPR